MHAVRNIRLCTKDCLCLYVCPTGATDTETGQIDAAKCVGCGQCALSCPSRAISMVPEEYPPQQKKDEKVVAEMRSLAASKAEQEAAATRLARETDDPVARQLAEAIAKSNRLMAEDALREAGFMLPQSGNVRAFLIGMLEREHGEGFPREAVLELLRKIKPNEKAESD